MVGNVVGANIVLDGDTYLQGGGNVLASTSGSYSQIGTVGLMDAAVLNNLGPTTIAATAGYDAAVTWTNGPAAVLNGLGNSRLAYTGAGTARFVGVRVTLNGQQKACVTNAVLAASCNIAFSTTAMTNQLDYDAAVEPGCLTAALGSGAGFCNMGDSGAGL